MARHRRRIAAVLVLVGASVALALLLSHASKDGPTAARAGAGTARPAHEALLERGQAGTQEADGAAAQEYADRAYPASEITISEIQGAVKANDKLQKKG